MVSVNSASRSPITDTKDGRQTLPITEPTAKAGGSRKNYNSSTYQSRTIEFFLTPISSKSTITSTLLLLLSLGTGVIDAATFIDYHLFVSNQTGNTVFLGIGALSRGTSIFDLRLVGLSLGGFLAGGLVSGQITANISASKRTRWWIVTTNLTQTALTFAAAALRQWYALVDSSGPNHGAPRSFSVVFLLAFASGLQVAMARALGVAEIPTGMITSAWIDLVADEEVWLVWKRNKSRDRRLAFVLCILVGGFIGTAASEYCARALPLLLAAIIKAVVTVGFLFDKGEDEAQMKGEVKPVDKGRDKEFS